MIKVAIWVEIPDKAGVKATMEAITSSILHTLMQHAAFNPDSIGTTVSGHEPSLDLKYLYRIDFL